MLERARRLRDLEGSPKVVVEHPDDFFAAARAEYPDAPVWSGELYLELHRATYTTQARTKAGNRRSEHLLREAELWAATAALHAPGSHYPYEELDRLWKTVLLHQFHDILPGSSIAWVHREAEADYARVAEELEEIIADAVTALRHRRHPRSSTPARSTRRGRRTADGTPGPHRRPRPTRQRTRSAPVAGPAPVTVDGRVLDNGLVRVEFDGDGPLASVRDLARRPRGPRPGTGATCCSCTPTCQRLGRLGHRPALPAPLHVDLTDADVGHRRRRGPAAGRDPRGALLRHAPGSSQTISLRAGSPPHRRRDRDRLARVGEDPQGRVPARRPRRPHSPPRSSSATSSGPRTPTPAGTPPASRSTATAGSTSPSPATASR